MHNVDISFINKLIHMRMNSAGVIRHAAGVLLIELLKDDGNPENRQTARVEPKSTRRTTDAGRSLANSSP